MFQVWTNISRTTTIPHAFCVKTSLIFHWTNEYISSYFIEDKYVTLTLQKFQKKIKKLLPESKKAVPLHRF